MRPSASIRAIVEGCVSVGCGWRSDNAAEGGGKPSCAARCSIASTRSGAAACGIAAVSAITRLATLEISAVRMSARGRLWAGEPPAGGVGFQLTHAAPVFHHPFEYRHESNTVMTCVPRMTAGACSQRAMRARPIAVSAVRLRSIPA